jgi:MFS family permease
MVLPFLSKYLKEDLDFSYGDVKWILISFGLGSMLGSYLGGKLADSLGFYKVMVFSLFVSGLMFFGLQYITSFTGLCFAMFGIMTIADMFRPAMFVSLGVYAKPENRTRALTLVRLAVNLGFAAGPALGWGAVGGAAITNLSDFYPTMPFLLNGVGGPGSTSSSTAATVPTSGAISPISTGGAGGGGIVVQGARSPGTGQGGALGGHGGMVIIATGSSQFAISSIGGGGAGLINAQTDGSRSCELSSGTNAGAMIIIEWN